LSAVQRKDFWEDSKAATMLVREKSNLEKKLFSYESLQGEFDSYSELIGNFFFLLFLLPLQCCAAMRSHEQPCHRWEQKHRKKEERESEVRGREEEIGIIG